MSWHTLGILAVDATLQGAALLGLTALVAAMLPRRTAAATRHLVWGFGLLALVAIAALAPLPARWQLAAPAPRIERAAVETIARAGDRTGQPIGDPSISTERADASSLSLPSRAPITASPESPAVEEAPTA